EGGPAVGVGEVNEPLSIGAVRRVRPPDHFDLGELLARGLLTGSAAVEGRFELVLGRQGLGCDRIGPYFDAHCRFNAAKAAVIPCDRPFAAVDHSLRSAAETTMTSWRSPSAAMSSQ